MKKYLLLCLVSLNLYSFEDFGTYGRTYDIKEENFQDILERETKDFFSKYNLKQKVADGVKSASLFKTTRPFCKNSFKKADIDYSIIPEDIYSPAGKLLKRKGDKIVIPTEKPINLCFVDGTNSIALENQIDYFKRITEKTGGCYFMVANSPVLDLYEKYQDIDIYPSGEAYENRFGVSCYPTVIQLMKEQRYTFTFNIQEFQHAKEVSK